MQAPLLLLERLVQSYAKSQSIELKGWIRVVLTLGVMEMTAAPFFFAAVEHDTNTAARVVRACEKNYRALLMLAGLQ